MPFDWHDLHASQRDQPAAVDSRRRMRIVLIGFLVLLSIVFARAVQLEVTQGAAFRAETAKPLRREQSLPGVRGRILAADGTVLACDRESFALAVPYRWLSEPSNEGDLIRRLQDLCDVRPGDWQRRAERIRARVERIAESGSRPHGREIAPDA